jgi:poly-gamma-glutamate synthesis protein (capsule biosynthesis protein)
MFALMLLLLSTLAFVDLGLDYREGGSIQQEYPWLYLREGRALEPEEQLVEIVAVGDIMLGRGVAGAEDVFSGSAAWLRTADLALGNFEGAIPGVLDHASSAGGEIESRARGGGADGRKIDPAYAPYRLLIPQEAPKALRAAGFDLLSLANNHTLDAGIAGLQHTASRLESVGIVPLGVEPGATIYQIDGLQIAFMALNLIPAGMDANIAEAIEVIQAARGQADVVVVSIHWGLEYQLEPSPVQVQLADQLSQAGADLVLGHHPHAAQPLEIIGRVEVNSQSDTLVAYSLGNFVFDQFDERTRQGLALRVFVDREGLRAAQVLPVDSGPRPRLAGLQDSAALLARVSPTPRRVGYVCDGQSCQPVAVPQEERSGIFWAGQIDLTGDGVPEVVKRTAQGVVIYQDGEPVWHSPPEWTVLDLALGDPNDDGRGEVLLALNKPGPQGALTSHPFILGYRGGSYRLLWGGSAVSDPLLEVELGNLDGDKVQELVVLEIPRGGVAQTVSVWRWHGWGFSQLWRGPEGSYQDMILLPGEEGAPARISVVKSWD